jgi:hypothetical protein
MALRMLDRIIHTAVWGAFGITVTIMLVNAFYMVISPDAWFRLPRWLGLQGVLTRDRYGSGWGALQLRILGVIIIVTLAWIAYGLFSSGGK